MTDDAPDDIIRAEMEAKHSVGAELYWRKRAERAEAALASKTSDTPMAEPAAALSDIATAIVRDVCELTDLPDPEDDNCLRCTPEQLSAIVEQRLEAAEQRASALAARLAEVEAALATARQSLAEQAEARSDPTMPLLKPEVVARLREDADAEYATAPEKIDRLVAHGLWLLCTWQERARAALAQQEGKRHGG